MELSVDGALLRGVISALESTRDAVRAQSSVARDQTAAMRELRDEIRILGDKIDSLRGKEPDERPTSFGSHGAMGDNGR